MASHKRHFLKIDLNGAVLVCGCCKFAEKRQFEISSNDFSMLEKAAETVLEAGRNRTVIPTETLLRITAFFNQVAAHKVFCDNQKCLVSVINDRCSL